MEVAALAVRFSREDILPSWDNPRLDVKSHLSNEQKTGCLGYIDIYWD